MQTIRMFGRLLWKEFREGWLVIAIAAVAPWAVCKVAWVLPDDRRAVLADIGSLCSPIPIVLWAAAKGGRRKGNGKSPLAHLPARPIVEHLVSIATPMVITALAGAWLGHVYAPHYLRERVSVDPLVGPLVGMLYMVVAFSVCYLISAVVSAWAGMSAGVAWVLVGLIFMDSLFRGDDPNRVFWAFLVRTAPGTVACLALFLALRKSHLRFGRITAVSLLAAIMFGPMAYDQFIAPGQSDYDYDNLYSTDRSLVLEWAAGGVVDLTDRRSCLSVKHEFDSDAGLVGFDADRCAYVVHQRPGSNRAAIIRWKGRVMKLVATVPVSRGAVRRSLGMGAGCNGSISPDRRYLTFRLRSGLGDGMDVWIVNLRTGNAWVAVPNSCTDLTLSRWLGSRLVLPGDDGIDTVDLVTRKTGTMKIPGQDGD